MEQAQEKESLLLVQTTDLSEYSLLNVRGMDAQELVAALADMSEDDKLSVQAYLESKGAWTTEIANQDTKEGMHLEGIYTKFNIDRPEDFTEGDVDYEYSIYGRRKQFNQYFCKQKQDTGNAGYKQCHSTSG